MKTTTRTRKTTRILAGSIPARFTAGRRILFTSIASLLAATSGYAAEAILTSGVMTGDADSGVTSAKTYTAIANVIGSNVTVNGATFIGSGGDVFGTGWSLSGVPSQFGGGGIHQLGGQDIANLFDGFQYDGNPGTLTLSGLTAGKTYVATLYNQAWTLPDNRTQTITSSEGASLIYNQDALAASVVRYTFVATGTTTTVNFTPLPSQGSLHVYGLSNEQVFNDTWSPNSGDSWNTAANWSTGVVPSIVGSNASFSAQGGATSVTLAGATTTGHVQFLGTGSYTVSGAGPLTIQADAGGVSVLSAEAGGSHTINAPVVLGSDLMKFGSGTVTLGGGVTGTKNVSVSNGTLQLGAATSNTASTTVAGGTTLRLTGGASLSATALSLTGSGALFDMNGGAASVGSLAGVTGTSVTTGGGALTVGSGGFGGDITGGGSLTKQGSGTLTLALTNTGATNITGGTLSISVAAGAARRFDASTVAGGNGASISTWNDLSANGANATVPGGNSAPTKVLDAGTGTGLSALQFNAGGGATTSQALTFTRDTNARTIFSIFKGGSFLITDSDEYDFHRPGNTNAADPLLASYGQIDYLGTVRVNGVDVDSTVDAMPTNLHNGYNLITLTTNGNPVQVNGFNRDRVYHSGNQSQAEVIIFDTVVSEPQRLQIEAYLNKKWFNEGAGFGNLLATTTPVTISGGGTFDISGENYQTVASLSGTDASGTKVNLETSALTFGDANNNTFDGIISGAGGSVIKQGGGTQILSGANTYTGTTTVSAGTLVYQNTYASASHTIASGATLEINVASGTRNSASTTFSGAGSLVKSGGGTLVWQSTAATFAMSAGSQIDVQGGNFTGGNFANEVWTNNLSSLNVASGAIFDGIEANVRVDALTGAGTIKSGYPGAGYANFTFGVNGGSGTFSGELADSQSVGNFVKTGTGTQTLSGTNTYTGTTTISVGTLVATNVTSLGTTAAGTTVTSGATLDVQANIGTEAISVGGTGVGSLGALVASTGTGTVGGAVALTADTSIGGAGTLNVNGIVAAGASTLTKVGAGTTNFGTASTLTSVGTLTAEAGTTNVNSVLGTGTSAVSVTGATTLKFGSVSQTLGSLTIGAGSTVTFTSGLASFSGGGKGAGIGGSAVVPEPGTLGLLLVGALGVLGRRRRNCSRGQ